MGRCVTHRGISGLKSGRYLDSEYLMDADVIVVGAGPAGISAALELAERGHSVLLIESGQSRFSASHQGLADAEALNDRHAAMHLCTRRQLGGATNIWGGRLVPYDPVDFMRRPFISDAEWPITYDDVKPYYARACEYFFGGAATSARWKLRRSNRNRLCQDFPAGTCAPLIWNAGRCPRTFAVNMPIASNDIRGSRC